MENKVPKVKDITSLTEEEKKAVLNFYNIKEEQKQAILNNYTYDRKKYLSSLKAMSEELKEVSLLIASACGVDIKEF